MRPGRFLLLIVLMITLIGITYYNYEDEIYIFYRDVILKETKDIKINNNEYYKDANYEFVQVTDNFIALNKQDLLNIIYTFLNSGSDNLKFFCSKYYLNCVDDISNIANNEVLLSNINNYVHPYNSFRKIYIYYTKHGDIEIKRDRNYTIDEIDKINNEVDRVIKQETNDNMSLNDKIKSIHNYIINNANYGTNDIIKKYPNIDYNKATGVLFKGYGYCGSYSDAMNIFLSRLGVENFKVASLNHVWNLVKYNNAWYHLDVTWDDPVTSDGIDRLELFFFLISHDRLKELDNKEHNFDINYYKEAM